MLAIEKVLWQVRAVFVPNPLASFYRGFIPVGDAEEIENKLKKSQLWRTHLLTTSDQPGGGKKCAPNVQSQSRGKVNY